MGFSGGGSNILKPHTHDSNILQDGGNLDFQGVTQGNMSEGSVTYSDGSNLQELVKPAAPAGEVLTFAAAATAPSWVVPGTNHDRLEQLASYETVNATTDTVTLTLAKLIWTITHLVSNFFRCFSWCHVTQKFKWVMVRIIVMVM